MKYACMACVARIQRLCAFLLKVEHLSIKFKTVPYTYIDLGNTGEPNRKRRTREVLEGKVKAFLVERDLCFDWFLDGGPHQIGHVPRSRQAEIPVRQPTHVANHVAAQRNDVLHHRGDVHPQSELST